MFMSLLRDFLETSTIHGLYHISSAKSLAARFTWLSVICACFGGAFFMVNNAFVEWNESPIATTITTRPISELVFPSVTVCPPRGSNTALNLALENVNNENFTKEQREQLLDFSTKTFLLEPNQRQASHLVDLVNPSNLRGLYKGEISLPEVTGKYTFAIKSRQSKGSFVTPEYGVGDNSKGFYSRFHHHYYQVETQNLASLVGNGALVIKIETQDPTEQWWFRRQDQELRLYNQLLDFSEASHHCEHLGGHLASITSQAEQDKVFSVSQSSSWQFVLLGGTDKNVEGNWTWSDGSLWNFTQWSKGEPSGESWYEKEKQDCLFLNNDSGQWHDLSCHNENPFICKVGLTRGQGNQTYIFNLADVLDGTFNLWWINDPSSHRNSTPGIRLSWYIRDGNPPNHMRAEVSALSGKLSTPGLGGYPVPQYDRAHYIYLAVLRFPENISDIVGDSTLAITVDVEIPETGGDADVWFQTELVFYETPMFWPDAEAFCASKNGHLASVASKEEQYDIVLHVFEKYGYEDNFWLGGSTDSDEGSWNWTNGSPWKIDFWRRRTEEPEKGCNCTFLATSMPEDWFVIGSPSVYKESAWTDAWSAWSPTYEYPFMCRQKVVQKILKDTSFTFQKQDFNFHKFYVSWKTSQEYLVNESTTVESESADHDLTTDRSLKLRKGGFTLTWFITDNTTSCPSDCFDHHERWEAVIEPGYNTGVLYQTLDLVAHAIQQNIEEDYLWETVLRHRWSNDIFQQASSCLSEQDKGLILKDVNRDLNLKHSEMLMPDEVLKLGTELFFLLHFCFETLQETVQLSFFHEDLLKRQNLRTIVLATLNNVLPRTEAIEDFTGMVKFFNELDKMTNFTKNVVPSMIAISEEDQLEELAHIGMPFIEVHKNEISGCLENHCNISDLIMDLGNHNLKVPISESCHSGDHSAMVSHPAHLVNADNSFSPSALIPFCAFKSSLRVAHSTTKHPKLNFTVCSSFLPDILEGQLCYTLRVNETGGKGKQNGLLMLLDLNENRDFHTTEHHHEHIPDENEMNLDTEDSLHDIAAKIQINAMLPVTKYGKGSYQMTSVKKMVATDHFLGLSSKIRNCEIESYDECRTKNLLAECECVPWELQNMREGSVCDPKGRSCIDNVIQQTYDCKTSCEGIYADVVWIDEEVGKSRTGGKEENRDAYNSLVEEYREYKRNYSRAFRFLASAVNTSFGQELNDSTLQLVQIFFDTASFDEIERDTEVKIENQISLIGGTMGLFTGFSIISGIEVIYFAIKVFFKALAEAHLDLFRK